MIAILLAPVYLLANYYLLRRVMGWVKAWFPFFRTARHWALPVAVQAFLACSIVIAFFLPEGRARRVMKLIGNYWLGVLLYVLLAVIAADLLRLLLGYVLPFKHIFVTTQMHRIAGCVCALVILIASIWGVVNARIIHVTPYDVTVDKTVEGMDEMKVVLVADLHLGYNIGEKQMQQMVDRINEQDADLVLMLSRPSLSGRETDRRSGYPTEGLGVIDIAKHRNGPTGEIYFRHDKSMTKLVDYEPDLEWMKKNTTR
mgnify:CR=1 FL=1